MGENVVRFLGGTNGQPGALEMQAFEDTRGQLKTNEKESRLRDLNPGPPLYESGYTSHDTPETQADSSARPSGCSTGCSSPADPGIQLTSDLARIVENWPTLPDHIKAAVMALVGTAPATSAKDTSAKSLDDSLPAAMEKLAGK